MNFLCRLHLHDLHPIVKDGLILHFVCSRCGYKRKPGWM